MTLKELRTTRNLTQKQAAALCGVSLRSYNTYENDASKSQTIKYKYLLSVLERSGVVDETHGILTVDEIKSKCASVFNGYNIYYCYLFGSYAKGNAGEQSDVDLLVSTDVTGIRFFGIAEKLRETLQKKVDVLDIHQLENNPALLNEILMEGIKIYDKRKEQ